MLVSISLSSSLISVGLGQKSPMPPHNVSVPSAIPSVLSMCAQRIHGCHGSDKVPDHGAFRSLTSAALRALREVLTYPGLASSDCKHLSCPSRDFLQGRKCGSADPFARLFREGCAELFRQRFSSLGPPHHGSLGGGSSSPAKESDLRGPEAAPFGSAVICASITVWAAKKRSRADPIARVSSRVRCKRRPPR